MIEMRMGDECVLDVLWRDPAFGEHFPGLDPIYNANGGSYLTPEICLVAYSKTQIE